MNFTHSLAKAVLLNQAGKNHSQVMDRSTHSASKGGGVEHGSTLHTQPAQHEIMPTPTYTSLDYTYNPYTGARDGNMHHFNSRGSTVIKEHSEGNVTVPLKGKLEGWESAFNWDIRDMTSNLTWTTGKKPGPQDTSWFSGVWNDFQDLKWYEQAAIISLALPVVLAAGAEVGGAVAGAGVAAEIGAAAASESGAMFEIGAGVENALAEGGSLLDRAAASAAEAAENAYNSARANTINMLDDITGSLGQSIQQANASLPNEIRAAEAEYAFWSERAARVGAQLAEIPTFMDDIVSGLDSTFRVGSGIFW